MTPITVFQHWNEVRFQPLKRQLYRYFGIYDCIFIILKASGYVFPMFVSRYFVCLLKSTPFAE